MARPTARRGTTVAEVMLAFAVLGVAYVVFAQFISATGELRRTTECRRLALQEASNVLERVAALSWDEITAAKLAEIKPSPALGDVVPTAKLQLVVDAQAGPPESKRVRAEVTWSDAAGRTVEPIGLTTFIYLPQND